MSIKSKFMQTSIMVSQWFWLFWALYRTSSSFQVFGLTISIIQIRKQKDGNYPDFKKMISLCRSKKHNQIRAGMPFATKKSRKHKDHNYPQKNKKISNLCRSKNIIKFAQVCLLLLLLRASQHPHISQSGSSFYQIIDVGPFH